MSQITMTRCPAPSTLRTATWTPMTKPIGASLFVLLVFSLACSVDTKLASGQDNTIQDSDAPATTEAATTEAATTEAATTQAANPVATGATTIDPGQGDLDEAVIARIDAKSMKEIESVAALLESALAKGLNDENKSFAKKMLGSVLLQRSQNLASEMMRSRGRAAAKLRDEALETLEQSVKHDDTLVEAYLLIARFNMLPGGDRDKVVSAATKAIELLVDQPNEQSSAYLLRATTYEEDQAEERLADLDAAINANDENMEAHQMRAAARLSSGDVDGAIEDLEIVLAKNPGNQELAETAVQQLVELNRVDDALGLITKTLEAKPSEGMLRMRGILYRMKGKEAEALADFNKALAMQPRDPMSLLQRAEIALGSREPTPEDIKSAKQDLKAAMEMAPRLEEVDQAVFVRFMIAIQEGRMADAIRDMKILVSRDPENVARQIQLGNLYIADKRPRKAIEVLTMVLDREPKNASALRGRGEAYLSVGEHKEAIDDYVRALKIMEKSDSASDNEMYSILNNLAWLLSTSPQDDARDGKLAVDYAQRAVDITEAKLPHILSTLAAAFAEAGDMEKAIEWSTKAVDLGREEENEQLKQLEEELESYKNGKPWREKQETEENLVPIISADDLIDT
ncbi:MAG: tetratricopeptide repeat protein [Pirellulaceae bacterium]